MTGMSASRSINFDEIKPKYDELTTKWGVITSKYDNRALDRALERIYKRETTLHSEKSRSGARPPFWIGRKRGKSMKSVELRRKTMSKHFKIVEIKKYRHQGTSMTTIGACTSVRSVEINRTGR